MKFKDALLEMFFRRKTRAERRTAEIDAIEALPPHTRTVHGITDEVTPLSPCIASEPSSRGTYLSQDYKSRTSSPTMNDDVFEPSPEVQKLRITESGDAKTARSLISTSNLLNCGKGSGESNRMTNLPAVDE